MSYHYIEPYKTADKILGIFEINGPRLAAYNIDAKAKERGCNPDNIRAALKQLEKDGYVQIDGNLRDWFIRTGIGATLFHNGGYERHFYNLNQAEEYSAEVASLNYQKTTVDLKNAKRVYATYHSTRIMAIIACVVSVILLLLKIAEVFGWIDKH